MKATAGTIVVDGCRQFVAFPEPHFQSNNACRASSRPTRAIAISTQAAPQGCLLRLYADRFFHTDTSDSKRWARSRKNRAAGIRESFSLRYCRRYTMYWSWSTNVLLEAERLQNAKVVIMHVQMGISIIPHSISCPNLGTFSNHHIDCS